VEPPNGGFPEVIKKGTNMVRLSEKEKEIFFRCRTCGRLVGTLKKESCGGHFQGPAYYVNLWEWLLIKLKILR
jgi:hypothetical protein